MNHAELEKYKKEMYEVGFKKGRQLREMAPGLCEWRIAEGKRALREGECGAIDPEYIQGYVAGLSE
jgi:hypothetical protein